MKRITLILTLALATTLTAAAQSYDYLTFRTADGTEKSLASDGLKITFADGTLTATTGSETATFTLADLATMFFAESATGIANATANAAPTAQIIGGNLVVSGAAGQDVSVYTTDGRRTATSGLAAGLYLVRIGQTTLKVVAQ